MQIKPVVTPLTGISIRKLGQKIDRPHANLIITSPS